MKNIQTKPKLISFSGYGQRVDVFTFDDEDIFRLLTVDGTEEDEIEELLGDMNEIFSETGGLINDCNLIFDDGTEFVINESIITSKTNPLTFSEFTYLLIKIENVVGIFDKWDLDGIDFDTSKIEIEKECIKFTENIQINLIHITLDGEFGDDADYSGQDINYLIVSSSGENYPVIINSD
jgi:hypothetical protein